MISLVKSALRCVRGVQTLAAIPTGVILFFLLLAIAPTSSFSEENPALWKYRTQGHFDAVIEDIKNGLEAAQFTITGEENLSKALARNRRVFGEDKWNTIGFQNATAVHFCSLVLNQEIFNISMDWSILCPFKVVAYTMKAKPDEVTILLARPTYLLEKDPHPQGREVGKSIENRIIEAITEVSLK